MKHKKVNNNGNCFSQAVAIIISYISKDYRPYPIRLFFLLLTAHEIPQF